jgi:hypothetical protein
MDVFVVVDTAGSGRIVGVFDDEAAAREVIGRWAEYYKLRRVTLNRVDPEVVDWARSEDQKAWLRQFITGP